MSMLERILKKKTRSKKNFKKIENAEFFNSLICAIARNHINVVVRLLECKGINGNLRFDVNCVDDLNESALMVAAKYGNTEITKCLLKARANVLYHTSQFNSMSMGSSISALGIALEENHIDVAELLLEHAIWTKCCKRLLFYSCENLQASVADFIVRSITFSLPPYLKTFLENQLVSKDLINKIISFIKLNINEYNFFASLFGTHLLDFNFLRVK